MSTKREIWEQMQKHMPQLAEQMREISEKLGPITEIKIETPEGRFEWKRHD